MRNFKIVIQYDGSRYKGWKNQKDNDLTIQGKLESVLSKMAEEKVIVIGSEHTDVGVHAENYVANFKTECSFSKELILDYLYEYLPEDIVVKEIEEIDDRFHARYNVKAKTYTYTINNQPKRNVFTRKYEYHIEDQLDLTSMRKAAEALVGTHDFKSFTSLKSDNKSTVKTIENLQIVEENERIKIIIEANDFLWNMPRLIVGTLLEVGQGNKKPRDIEAILEAKEKTSQVAMAKAKALTLTQMEY